MCKLLFSKILKMGSSVRHIYNKVDENCLRHIRTIYDLYMSLEKLITSNLRTATIETRPAESNGLWCFTLLPVILFLYSQQYDVPQLYRLATYLSIGLSCYCILFIFFMSVSCLVLRESFWGGCLPSGLIGCLLVYCYVRQDMVFAAMFTLPPTFIFNEVLRTSLAYPKTFTIGEAMIVAQAIVISSTVVVANYTWYLSEEVKMDLINVAIATVLSTVGLIVTALCHLKQEQRTLVVLGKVIGAAALLELMELHLLLGWDCLPRLLYFIFMDHKRRQLIGFWLLLVIVAIFVLYVRTNMAVKATTTTRKAFHVMAAFVFASGVFFDISLMKLAAGLGLGLVILVEALRKSNIEPISPALQSAFLIYSDEKDCGAFAMTPIYLYVGLAGPLWLAPGGAPALERLAGVLAAGVGDSAASWFGSRYGERPWPGSNRTMEGTLFNILSQIITVYGLVMFDFLDRDYALFRTVVAATASSLVEAKTEQVDNLILPLITLIAFQTTYLFC